MCAVRNSTPLPRRRPSRKFSWPSRAITSAIFFAVYLGMRANSAAIQPRLRAIARMVSCRFASLQSGNASCRLKLAVLRSLGVSASSVMATAAPVARASQRGIEPTALSTDQLTAYASHCFIARHFIRLRVCKYKPGNPMLERRGAARLPGPEGINGRGRMARGKPGTGKGRCFKSESFRLSKDLQPAATGNHTVPRLAWALLVALTLYVCYFRSLHAIGFVGPDEPRYAWNARDMAESGDWVTPRLYGRPWFEKPPLLYWGAAVFFRMMPGQPEIAARLPSAICALLATLALAWLAWRAYGEECARWLAVLLPTTAGMIGFSHACATDMPFAGMLTISLVLAAVILGAVPANQDTPLLPRTPWIASLLFGVFLGLAVLAKGPAALVLLGGTVFLWALFTKRWRDGLRLLHPAAIAAFSLTALPWYVLCGRRNPDFLRVFIVEHNFKRYLTPEFQHLQPFWFYLPVVAVAVLPWILAAAASLDLAGRRAPGSDDRALRILVCNWCAWNLVFFSLSRSKLPGYILPAVPCALFLLMQALFASGRPPVRRRFSLVAGASLTLAAALIVAFDRRIPGGQDVIPAPWHASIYLPLFFGGLLTIALAWRKRLSGSLASAAATVLLAAMGVQGGLRQLDTVYSARQGAQAARAYPGFASSEAAVYEEARGVQFGLNFYLRRELPAWSVKDARIRWVFTSRSGVERLENAGFECPKVIVFPAALPCQLRDSLGERGREP